MKILYKNINEDNSGIICLLAQHNDDLLCAYNLLEIGNTIKTVSTRKVSLESSTKQVQFKVSVELILKIETIEYHSGDTSIRVKGINLTGCEHVQVGKYHTHEITVDKKFSIGKESWNWYYFTILDEACDSTQNSDLSIILIQEGVCNVFMINKYTTILKSKIVKSIPKKRQGYISQREKALKTFYSNVVSSIMTSLDFNTVKCIIIAGPGFVKDDLLKYIVSLYPDPDYLLLRENKFKFITASVSSAFRYSLSEIFSNQALIMKLGDTKAFLETQALCRFHQMLTLDPYRVCYGPSHVEYAISENAVETLLICNNLLQHSDIVQRKRYLTLAHKVHQNSGEIRIFTIDHESGKELIQYSGIAAILRYPLQEIDSVPFDENICESFNKIQI